MALKPNPPSTNLCCQCKTFQFSDTAFKGSAGNPEEDRQRRQRQLILPEKINDTLPDLPTLRRGGCDMCHLFYRSISRSKLDYKGDIECELRFIWGRREECPERRPSGLIALVMKVSAKRTSWTELLVFLEFGICSHEDGDEVSRWLRLERLERPSPLDECNTRFLKAAIDGCDSTCHPSQLSAPYVPTRLIDLKLGSSEDPRLIITSEAFAPVKYAALSYCWGSRHDAERQLKTEKGTLESHKGVIRLESMSKVMKDAVETCRVLEIGYLWIDALCIIQDDDYDWAKESAVMGSVYEGAFITICALSSSSCHQGFLTRSTNKLRVPFRSEVDPAISGSYTMIDRGTCQFFAGLLGNPMTEDLQRSSWDQRAWAFQEKELSQRLILFGHRMLHFHCGIWDVSENRFWFRVSPMFPQALADALRKATRHPKKEKLLYDVFQTFSKDYAGRELTFAKDRLPAISGPAKSVYEGTGDQYLAGIWAKDLHIGLIWHIPEFPDSSLQACINRCRTTASEIPSWSWASRRGYFDHTVGSFVLSDERHTRPEFTLVSASTIAATANPFGAVSGGKITVQGRVMALPSDLMALERGLFIDRMWRVRRGESYVAHCQLDWDEAGSDHIPAGKLLLLLLTSSCGERESSASSGPDTADYNDDDGNILESEGDGNAEVEGESDGSCEELGEEEGSDNEEMYEGDDEEVGEGGEGEEAGDEEMDEGDEEEDDGEDECPLLAVMSKGGGGHEYSPRRIMSKDSEEDLYPLYGVTSADEANDCSSCISKTNRNAWGLVIHPANTPDNYYRVGIFTSRAGGAGGTELFTNLEYQVVTLI